MPIPSLEREEYHQASGHADPHPSCQQQRQSDHGRNRPYVVEPYPAVALSHPVLWRCVILISSRPLSFLDLLGPPVEERGGADEIAARLQGDAALGLGIFELVDGSEVAIG